MSKFKVGDRVRVIESIYKDVPKGTEGRVVHVAIHFCAVNIYNEQYSFYDKEIELVDAPKLQDERRERFAVAAMQGMLSLARHRPDVTAELAVKYADALIKELDKEKV